MVTHSSFVHYCLTNFGHDASTAVQGDLHRCGARRCTLRMRAPAHLPAPGGLHWAAAAVAGPVAWEAVCRSALLGPLYCSEQKPPSHNASLLTNRWFENAELRSVVISDPGCMDGHRPDPTHYPGARATS